jgi:hypothetical protein
MHAYFACMTAKNKQTKRKVPAVGISVGNRFRADAYFQKREQLLEIDQCAAQMDMSRSEFITAAALEKLERECRRLARQQ